MRRENTPNANGAVGVESQFRAASCRRAAQQVVERVVHSGVEDDGQVRHAFRTFSSALASRSTGLRNIPGYGEPASNTLVVFGTEFGRTSFAQGTLKTNFGRDHHGGNFCVFMAGAGVKPGFTYGETDDFGYNIVRDPVHIHDLNATILHIMGIDHLKLTYRSQGRDFRLTDVHGTVVKSVLA